MKRQNIRVFYGKAGHDLGGINVKIKRLERFLPNINKDYNIIYTVDDRIPPSVIRKAKAKGVKIVQNFGGIYHRPYKENYRKYNEPIIDIHNNLADHVIYQSEFSKRAADHFCRTAKENSEILYNAVDTNFFKPPENKEFGYNILTAGFFRFKSRLEPVVRAFAAVVEKYPQARLTIAGKLNHGRGEFDVARAIPSLVNKLKLTDYVTFLGQYRQEEAPLIYRPANLFVHAKYKDWCPNVVIEAMACGLPIVFNDTGGVRELVKECGLGLRVREKEWHLDEVPSLDPEELAVNIMLGLENQIELGKKARLRAVENFDIEAWLNRHLSIFEKFAC